MKAEGGGEGGRGEGGGEGKGKGGSFEDLDWVEGLRGGNTEGRTVSHISQNIEPSEFSKVQLPHTLSLSPFSPSPSPASFPSPLASVRAAVGVFLTMQESKCTWMNFSDMLAPQLGQAMRGGEAADTLVFLRGFIMREKASDIVASC